MDGLAAGIAAIMAAFRLVFFQLDGNFEGATSAAILLGATLGFLVHNRHPARIFMGDAGALFLGLLMAVTTITIGGRADYQYTGTTYFFFAPLVIPLLILGVPIVDTAFSFLRRVLRGHSFSVADKDHLHHRLMRLGHGPRRTVVLIGLWTALLSGLALVPTFTTQGNANALVPIGVVALALLLYGFFFPGRREAQAIAAEEAAEAAAEAAEAARGQVIDLGSRRRGTGH
jgi:UDP-GlcNAc:undecaprenyl-phosphate GlcNAc-1-phosphate transferase